MFASKMAVADANVVTIGDYVADVEAWVAVIRKEPAAPCVWLLGRSEGGLVALAAAQKVADVCGLVLVSTAGRPLGEVLRTHANPANAPILDRAMSAIDALEAEAGKHVDVAGIAPGAHAAVSAAGAGLPDRRVLLRSRQADRGRVQNCCHHTGEAGRLSQRRGCRAAEASGAQSRTCLTVRYESRAESRDVR